ncbi:hypothetical protein [Pseudomonas sp. DP16D-R1]|jgi:hypothetical protein|uniref:hypothetical protein n=1 Tax=Pseudomonas sp. DP16D-R1 TaxID=2075551 RepID=UPI0011AF9900|nr:hypothetical protein [Pseudomonas sp. DP16D-R1]MDZ4262995.1 hypothetical protein [Pseudomonadota bacterium]
MKYAIRSVLILAIFVSAGCSSLSEINARGQALYQADPESYDEMPNSNARYFELNPQYNAQGS